MPASQNKKVIKEWSLDKKMISAAIDGGKLHFYVQHSDSDDEPVLIDSWNIVGLPAEVMKNPASWEKFLANTWVRLSIPSDGSFKLYIDGKVKGAGNTIDPTTEPEKLWPGAVIPFEIDTRTYPVNQQGREIISQAIDCWRRANTGFVFVSRTTEPDYVIFGEDEGVCHSHVGRKPGGGPQYIRCDLDGTGMPAGQVFDVASIIHEIGHVIGLHHEQSRRDRDRHVQIVPQKIEPSSRHNFSIAPNSRPHGSYDYDSIMHYGRQAFSRDGSDTIIPPAGVSIGQRDHISAGDIAAAKYLAEQGKRIRPTPAPAPQSTPTHGDAPSASARWQPHLFPQAAYASAPAAGAPAASAPVARARTRPAVWEILLRAAKQSMQAEDYPSACMHFKALFAEYGDSALFNGNRILTPQQQAKIFDDYGIALVNLGNHQAALQCFMQALQLNPRDQDIRQHIAIAQERMPSCSNGCSIS